MGSKTLTISCPESLLSFLEDNKSISASKLFQTAVENLQNSIKHNPQLIEANKMILLLQKQSEKYQDLYQKAVEFLTIKGLWGEFDKS